MAVVNSTEGLGVVDNKSVTMIGKALGHRTKVQIIRDLRNGKPTSPTAWSAAHREPLGNVAYHFKSLGKLGILEVVETVQRRGAIEHFHVLGGPLAAAVLVALEALDDRLEPVAVDEANAGRTELDSRDVVNSTGAVDA